MNYTQRYYQTEAHDAVFSALTRNVNTQMLVCATGTGKTKIGVGIAKEFKKVLWLTHNEELISQSAIALLSEELEYDKKFIRDELNIHGGLFNLLTIKNNLLSNDLINKIHESIGVVKESLLITDKRITIASVQTIWRRLDQIPANIFDCIVVDECHHSGAPIWTKILDHFTPKLRLGLTATPWRFGDDMSLTNLFEEIVYEYPIAQGIKDGYLCKPDAIRVKTSANLDRVRTTGLDFNQKDLSEKINTPERNIQIVKKYQEYALGRPFIAFCCGVQHAIDLCETFNELGVKANYVVGDKELSPERKKIIEGFISQDYFIEPEGLINVMIATEGFDYEDVGCIINACPTKSKTKFWQIIGRGIRLKTPKFLSKFTQSCIILDIVDGTTKHRLINTETEDNQLSLEDKIFISEINRQKLLDVKFARERKLEVQDIAQDEKMELLPLPKVKIKGSYKRMKEPATEAQLRTIRHWGYDTENVNYTHQMCAEIFMSQSAALQDIKNLESCGYNVSNGVTVAEAKAAYEEITIRDARANTERLHKEGKLI